MASEALPRVLAELRSGFAALYGARLRRVYLFGSYARHDQDDESDLDILVVLASVRQYADEVARTSPLVSDLSLALGISISPIFVPETAWQTEDTPFFRNVRAEAVAM